MPVSLNQAAERNDRLRAAIVGSGLRFTEVADRAGVDPKTLERWIAGRVPHPRNRHALAEALGVDVADLWPDLDPFQHFGPQDLAGIQCAFPSRSAFLSAFPPEQLFREATAISIAGLSNNLLCQQYADQRLEELICQGTTVSCLFLDPSGAATAAREVEELHSPGHLAALTTVNIACLQRLRDRLPEAAHDRLRLATYDRTIRFNLIFVDRLEGRLGVIQPYLPDSRGVESPTLVLRQTLKPGLFETFAHVFDHLAKVAKPC